MNNNIETALKHLQRANYVGYFGEMDKVVPATLRAVFNEHKGKFIAGQAPWNFYQQLEVFARDVGQKLNNSVDNQANERIRHIGRQINMGSGSTYIENQTINNPIPQFSQPLRKKILFIAANPENAAHIATDKEYRLIKAELRNTYDFLMPEFAVTIQELIRAVNTKPQIIHFAGHGERKGIIITDEHNQAESLPLPALQLLFKPLQASTELVLLNSCYSAFYAEEISKFGMYVVGYPQPINDEAAIGFAQGLYIGLSEGKTFEEAFKDAMIVLLTKAAGYPRGLGTDKENSAFVEVWKDGRRLEL